MNAHLAKPLQMKKVVPVVLQKTSCYAFLIFANLFRRSGRHNAASALSSAGPHINDIICVAYHIQVMLDDNDRRPARYEPVKNSQQRLHIQRMQADGRLIENKHRSVLLPPHLRGQFEALGFSAGKTGRRLSQGQITKPQIL